MISKLGDVAIDPEHPFAGCKLGREKYAEILTQIVSQYDNCVLAINSEWGTGKTTFIKMWQQHLINNGFNALYFNVWENDFISDPLIGFIGEFKELSKQYNLDTELSKVTNAASKIVLSMLPALVEAIAKQYIGDNAVNVIKGCAQGVTDVLSKEFQDYEEQKNSIKEFREALQNFISQCKSDKPLIFFVDELDRCNPAYAVKVLERIKHLFSIPNIVFVLSIDKKQLCNAIKGYYGSESLDADNYLKRFIDIEYSLPEPSYGEFCNYLYDRFEINKNIHNLEFEQNLITFSVFLFKFNKLSLRQIEKIYSHAGLAISCNKKLNCDCMLFIFFAFLKVCHSEIYTSFEQKKYKEPQELVDALEPLLPENQMVLNKVSTVLAEIICVYYSQNTNFTIEGLNSKIESVSFHKTNTEDIKQDIIIFSGIFDPDTTFNKLTLSIDLLINFS
jgi:Predicted P-loop ATPase